MSFFSGKRLKIILHVAAWAIIILLPVYLLSYDRPFDNRVSGFDNRFTGRIFLRTAVYILIFYVNFFWLIPKLLFKERKITYYLSVIVMIVGLYFVNESLNREYFSIRRVQRTPEKTTNPSELTPNPSEIAPNQPQKRPKEFRRSRTPWKFDIYNYIFTSVLISGVSIGLRLSDKYSENEKKRKELEKEKLSSELAFLKNQVSPHFFFNTLNNIYSLTEINTKEAQNAILQLSKLMRYLLYESEKGDTRLSNEISFMKNYIELMKLRLSEKVALTFSFPEKYQDVLVPPLIFIPFIENAFKHGVSYSDKSFINIELKTSDTRILFSSKNSINRKPDDDLSNSGIGLENVKKRLALLFPEKHLLEIKQVDNVFEVFLSIDIILL